MASENVVCIEDDNWESEVLSSDIPVLVDFWTEGCPPCRMIAPILDELADEFAGKLKIAKVDAGRHHQLAGDFAVRSVPTLFVFKDGVVQEQRVGGMSKAELTKMLSAHVG